MKDKSGDFIITNGVIKEILRGDNFHVTVKNGDTESIILARLSGKMRRNHVWIIVGDVVQLEIPILDPTRGRITWRHR